MRLVLLVVPEEAAAAGGMSRGPGRWQRELLAALRDAGDFNYVWVSGVGLAALGRSFTPSEYRAMNRAAWLLRDRGHLHLGKMLDRNFIGRLSAQVYAWTCPNCSHVATGEHIPALRCMFCKTPTTDRAPYRPEHPDCGCNLRKTWASAAAALLAGVPA